MQDELGMNRLGVLHFKVLEANGNGERFNIFLQELIPEVTNAYQHHHPIIILDNVAFHHNAVGQQLLANAGIGLKFLPPYSPFFNPIEALFSSWKNHVKRLNSVNEIELFEAIWSYLDVFTPAQATNFVAHAHRNCALCAQGLDPIGFN